MMPAPDDKGARVGAPGMASAMDVAGTVGVRWLYSLPRMAPRALGVAVAAPLLSGVLLLFQAWLLASLLDQVIVQGARPADVFAPIVLIAGLVALRALIAWAGELAAHRGAQAIKARLREDLFAQVLAAGPAWTGAQVSGTLATLVLDHVEALDGFLVRYLPSLAAAAILPLLFGVILLPVDWIAALLLLVTAPLIPVFMALVGWGAQAASQRHQLALGRLAGLFADRVRGALTLRLLRRVEAEVDTVQQASHDLSRRTMRVLRIAFLSSAVLEFFAALGVAGVALYVGLRYLGYLGGAPDMSLQAGLFCLLLAPDVYMPLRHYAANYHDKAAARAAADEIQRVFGILPDVGQKPQANVSYKRGPARGAARGPGIADAPRREHHAAHAPVLELEGLSIRPGSGAQPVLHTLNASLARGEHAALLGMSGSGKTSLLEGLCGWRGERLGRMRFCGVSLGDNESLDVRDGVVLITQRPFLAPASIAENLRMADAQASEDGLWHALNKACADDFVRRLPQGLDTVLGVGGYGLSGGQQQRLGLARLFLTDPLLILLDEPTAYLDAGTRDAVIASVLHFSEGRSLLVATHDVSVACRFDVTWRLGGGHMAVS